MKKRSFLYRLLILAQVLCLVLPLAACGGGGGSQEPQESETNATEPLPEVKYFDLIENGESLFTIVRPDEATVINLRAATRIGDHLEDNGIKSKVTYWGDESGTEREILVGYTYSFPMEALADVTMTDLGRDGFVIKHWGNKILLAANHEAALMDAAEYLIANFLDVQNGKTRMPEGYCYCSGDGLLLNELKLGGFAISRYTLSCDAGLEESLGYLDELIYEKSGVKLSSSGTRKILLTTQGVTDSTVSASFEGGNLVIRAKDAASMKKAIVCFWFENVAYATDRFDLPSSFHYSRDLSKTVFYSDFNVKQSDNECCMDAMIAAHEYANEHGYKVFADYGAQYYINSTGKSVIIKTDVEWGNARITIDDSEVPVEKRTNWIFRVPATTPSYTINSVTSIKRDATNLGIPLPQKSIVTLHDSETIHYIRSGGNADSGQTKRDSIVVDTDGSIDMDAPLMWDFDKITSITVQPIDTTPLQISGGIFTTVVNTSTAASSYYNRGINVTRSNTVVNGFRHYLKNDTSTASPYNAFLYVNDCAYVTVQSCVFTGHKKTGNGTYDIGMKNSISVTFVDCYQSNNIVDDSLWGLTGTNYCKNFVFDGCVISRVDAHKGVANATIKDSVIGFAGATIIGYGTLLIENSIFLTDKIVALRTDYGSSWEGEVIIRGCTVSPIGSGNVYLITGKNTGTHNFGYDCYMPTNVTIEDLTVLSTKDVYVFGDLNPNCKSAGYTPKYPYHATKSVTAIAVTLDGNKTLKLSPNQYLFARTEFNLY